MHGSRISGFTLVELLIVVIILGVLAGIILPQFGQASSDARLASLTSNLQTIRGQLQTYKTEHTGGFPNSNFETQMTQFSDISGGTAAETDSVHSFGPYLMSIPRNTISNTSTVRVVTGATTEFSAPTTDGGWYLNSTTGEFRADLKDSWATSDGTKFNSL
jgi:general secretion pathway protein G